MALQFPGLQYTSVMLLRSYVVYHSDIVGDHECWIGLYKSASDNSYYWLDGSSYTYPNWGDNEPDNEQCVLIYNGKFHDRKCSYEYRYVCKGIYF